MLAPGTTRRRRWRGGLADSSELRVGLGCMRLSTDADRDEERAIDTIAAAAGAGITASTRARTVETRPSPATTSACSRALRACGATSRGRIVTKGGMARREARWVPDGRAKVVRADCEASLEALDGLPIDLYLLHAPDPRTPWRPRCAPSPGSSTRAGRPRRRLEREPLQLDEALGLAPVAAVEIALGPFEDRALRGGVVDRCAETGIAVIAHSLLGGPRRARSLDRRPELVELAAAHDATAAEVALAWSSVSGRTSSRSRGRGGPRRRARPREPRRSSSPPRSARVAPPEGAPAIRPPAATERSCS